MIRRFITAIVFVAALLGATTSLATAHAATLNTGQKVIATAELKRGAWYRWGGNGPNTFDCSGLVVWAAKQHGIALPRTTQQMIHSGHLYRTYSPRQGDLAFWGPASAPTHVEFWTIYRWTSYGERKSGTRAGWRNDAYWRPTEWYRFR